MKEIPKLTGLDKEWSLEEEHDSVSWQNQGKEAWMQLGPGPFRAWNSKPQDYCLKPG